MNALNERLFRQASLVGGNWISASERASIQIVNPSTQAVIGQVPKLQAEDVQAAIDAAKVAQKAWQAHTSKERAHVLRRWFDLIAENKADLARILTSEQGKPLAEAEAEIAYGASFVEWYAEEARRIYGDIIPSPNRNSRILVMKQPVGIVAAITPWNFPNAMITRKAAPAFAAGCAVISKPAPQTPFSAIALAILAEEAGVPKGLFSVLTGSAQEIGSQIIGSPSVNKVSFTGSTTVGVEIYKQSAATVKRISLELGGNAPFIVFDDADIDAAVQGAIQAKFRNNGQACVSANRIYIHDKIYDSFANKLAEAVSGMEIGDGFDSNVVLGPLIDEAALMKVEVHIADALNKGARVAVGGRRHRLGGTFYEATVLTGADQSMKVAREETFGPLAALFRFDDEKHVIEMANDTQYGLASYFYTRDLSRAFRVAEAIECGMIGVNTGLISTAEAPFGGMKLSGLGREGSKYGIDEFTETKYICVSNVEATQAERK